MQYAYSIGFFKPVQTESASQLIELKILSELTRGFYPDYAIESIINLKM